MIIVWPIIDNVMLHIMMADGTNKPLCDFEIEDAEFTLKPSINLIEEENELVINNLHSPKSFQRKWKKLII